MSARNPEAKIGFLGTGADSPWVNALYEALAEQPATEVRAALLRSLRAPSRVPRLDGASRRDLLYTEVTVPPAYATTLKRVAGPWLRRRFASIYRELARRTADRAFAIVTNPLLAPFFDFVPGERLIYWNFDDYRLFQARRADEIETREDAIIAKARLTLCASWKQVEQLSNRNPGYRDRIVHFPNAVRREWICSDASVSVQSGTVGYVGNMGSRVDWEFVHDVAAALSGRRFLFVGEVTTSEAPADQAWQKARERARSLSNVEFLGRVAQEDVWRWYRSFEIGWMPYDIADPFNIACCPTKIFDAMASARPFVSTMVPEVLLYSDWIVVVADAGEAREAIGKVGAHWDEASRVNSLQMADRNTWHARAVRLLQGIVRDRS